MSITNEQIAELRRLEAAATPGVWAAGFNGVRTLSQSEIDQMAAGKKWPMMSIADLREVEIVAYTFPDRSECDYEWENCYGEKIGVNPNSEADAKFIAASRNALPDLLDELQRLRAVERAADNFLVAHDEAERFLVERHSNLNSFGDSFGKAARRQLVKMSLLRKALAAATQPGEGEGEK